MSKKATLSQALGGLDRRVTAPSIPFQVSVQHRTPSREGKRAIAGFFAPEVSKQLKHIGLERDASVQDMLREALNDLFEKYGRSPIA